MIASPVFRLREVSEPAAVARLGDDPNVLAAWASALLLLNDLSAVRPILQKLTAMGYRTPDFEALVKAKKLHYAVDPDVVRRIANGLTTDEGHEIQ